MNTTTNILWQGLAVIDAKGRAQLWNGGQTPKLYRSEEQGRYACTDGSTLEEVTIVLGRVSNVLAENDPARLADLQRAAYVSSAPRPAPPAVDAPRRRRFKPKPCAGCTKTFQPSGPRSRYCEHCP